MSYYLTKLSKAVGDRTDLIPNNINKVVISFVNLGDLNPPSKDMCQWMVDNKIVDNIDQDRFGQSFTLTETEAVAFILKFGNSVDSIL
jgi:hypothetical protein